jgi:hypothetical protein
MLGRVALVGTDISEELSASFIRVTRIGELGTTLDVTSNRCTLLRNTTWYIFWLVFEDFMLPLKSMKNIVWRHGTPLLMVVTANVPSSLILFTLMIGSDEFLRNVSSYKKNKVSNLRRRHSSQRKSLSLLRMETLPSSPQSAVLPTELFKQYSYCGSMQESLNIIFLKLASPELQRWKPRIFL